MMKTLHSLLIAVTLFFCFSSKVFSQQNWELLNPTPTTKTGLNIQFVSKNIGYILNENEILETLDSGTSWKKKQNIESGKDLKFFNTIGFIVGNSGYILKSVDSGASWSKINSGYLENFNTVTIIDSDTIIISSQNSLVKSSDGGNTWSRLEINKGSVNKTFFTSALVGHAACANGTMLKTIDGGATWYSTMSTNVYPSGFFTVYFINEKIGFATREHSYLFKTTDGGETWIEIKNIIDALFSFSFINEDIGYATGDGGALFKTVDGGLTWTWVSFQNGRTYLSSMYGIYFLDENNGFATGHRGRIVKTTDGGKTWNENSPTYNDIRKLDFVTKEIGYAQVGNQFYKTTDAGKKWSFVSEINYDRYNSISTFKFVNENIGYAVSSGYNGYFFKTTDGGLTWVVQAEVNQDGINTISLISEDIIYASGGFNQRVVKKSIDGGKTWKELANFSFYRMQFFNENVGYAHILYDKNVYKTVDGGSNWSVVFTGDEEVQSIDFIDVDNGYIVGSNALIYKTKNGGLDWQKLSIPYEFYNRVKFYSKNVGYIFDEEGQLFKTENAGKTWEKNINFVTGFTNPQSIHIIDKDIYLAGINGKIMKSQIDFKPFYLDLDAAKNIKSRSVTLSGSIVSNESEIKNTRLEILDKNYSVIQTLAIEPGKVSPDSSVEFELPVTDLNPDTNYQYRIVVTINEFNFYSNPLLFKTDKDYKLKIEPTNNFSATTAVVNGSVLSYKYDISDIEFEYSTKQDFSDYDNFKINTGVLENTSENITATLSNLMPKTVYYVRVKAIHQENKIYSEITSFTTKPDYEISLYNPGLSGNDVILNAYVLSNDKDITNIVFEYGIMNYENSISPVSNQVPVGQGQFLSATLTNVDKTKVYFYRLKALNGEKTIYSKTEILNYTRTVVLYSEVVDSDNINETVQLKGIINPGGAFLTNIQFEYGTTEELGSSKQSSQYSIYGNITVAVDAVLDNLSAGQKYYYRLKAANGNGFVYSDILSFTTANLSVDDFKSENAIILYPNPTNGIVNIELKQINKRIASLRVIDQFGKVISNNKVESGNSEIVNLEGKSTGIYFIQLILDDESKINKKVILK